MALGVFMILRGTARAEDGSYSLHLKEAGFEKLFTEFIIHNHKTSGLPDSKEVKLIWTETVKSVSSHCKLSGLLAMDDVTGKLQQDLKAQASLTWSY